MNIKCKLYNIATHWSETLRHKGIKGSQRVKRGRGILRKPTGNGKIYHVYHTPALDNIYLMGGMFYSQQHLFNEWYVLFTTTFI